MTVYNTHLAIGHNEAEIIFLNRLVEENMGGFIEVGVHVGGLAHIMLQIAEANPDFRYLGIDHNSEVLNRHIRSSIDFRANTEIWIADAWSFATRLRVSEWMIATRNTCIIYCDGGDKPKELTLYEGMARPGDILMVHDYGTYEGGDEFPSKAEISPEQAGLALRGKGFVRYEPSWMPREGIRIAAWRK